MLYPAVFNQQDSLPPSARSALIPGAKPERSVAGWSGSRPGPHNRDEDCLHRNANDHWNTALDDSQGGLFLLGLGIYFPDCSNESLSPKTGDVIMTF
jgi:hypothetical protein